MKIKLNNEKVFLKISILLFYFMISTSISYTAEIWPNRFYLATYPRSGNHWMRYMLEELTGKATGSVYADADEPVHLTTIFPWGGYAPRGGYEGTRSYPQYGEFYILKTHFPVIGAFDPVQVGAVRIVRNPLDSFYSYAVYVGICKDSKFPEKFIDRFIKEFKSFQDFWDNQDNVFTVRYEDLLISQEETLKKVASFIGIPFSNDDLRRVTNKYPPIGKYLKHKKKFSKELIYKINVELKDFLIKYDYKFD